MAAALEPSFGQSRQAWPSSGWGFSLPSGPEEPVLAIAWHEFEPAAAPGPLPDLGEHHQRLDHVPESPNSALPRGAVRLREKWRLAVAASLLLHAGAGLFLIHSPPQTAEIAGADSAGIAFLGNAPDDQLSSGEIADKDMPDAIKVTMIEMLVAKPVETVAAENPVLETITPTRNATAQPAKAAAAAMPQTVQPTPGDRPKPVAVARVAPEILDTLKPATDDNTVQPVATARSVGAVETEAPKPVEVAQAAQPEAERVRPTVAPEVQRPVPVMPAEVAKPAESKVERQSKQQPAKKAAVPPAPKKKQAAKAGSGGRNQTDARRGQAEGQVDGSSVARSKGGARNGEVGNAAVSNYPGKVRSKLARTFRAPRVRAGGDVVVAFSVSANGGVRSARVISSSGQAEIDRAALDAVHRASPFPPIPAGAGRSTWDFRVPLSVRR